MLRKLARLTLAGVACTFGMLFTVGAILAEPREDKVTSIHDIMQAHKPKGSLAKIKEGVKAEKWDDIAKAAKEIKQFGEDLGKNKPEKGDDASWKKLSAEYKKTTAAIAEGVEKKDAKATNAALATMTKSCKSCHDVHK